MLNISSLCDSAFLFVKKVLGKYFTSASAPKSKDLFLGAVTSPEEKAELASPQTLIILGNTADWQRKAIEKMLKREKIILDHCLLESVAALCFKHNYRWSLGPASISASRRSLLLEPSLESLPEAEPPTHSA